MPQAQGCLAGLSVSVMKCRCRPGVSGRWCQLLTRLVRVPAPQRGGQVARRLPGLELSQEPSALTAPLADVTENSDPGLAGSRLCRRCIRKAGTVVRRTQCAHRVCRTQCAPQRHFRLTAKQEHAHPHKQTHSSFSLVQGS